MRNHIHRHPVIFLTIQAILGGLLPVLADRPLEEALPEDTLFLVKVSNYGQLLEDMEEHPLLSFWKEDEVQEFFEPIISQLEEAFSGIELKEELGLEDEQFKEMFPGQMVFAMTELDMSELKKENYSGDFIGLAEYGGDFELIDKLIHHSLEKADTEEGAGAKAQVVERDYLGARLWMLDEDDSDAGEDGAQSENREKEREVWAVYEDILMVSTSLNRIHETISLLDGQSRDASIAANPTYARMVEDGRESELFFFMNLRKFFTSLKADVLKDSQSSRPNLLAITPDGLWQALAPEVLDGIYITLDTDSREPVIYSGFLYSEKRGISSLLAFGQGEISKPDYISKEVLSAKVTLFSLSEFWGNLENLIAAVSPFVFQYYQALLDQLKTSSGVDFKASFFDNFEDEIVSFSEIGRQTEPGSPPALEDSDTVIVFSLKDRQGFEMALESLKSMIQGKARLFEEREYLDVTIFTYNPSTGSEMETSATEVFSYALTNRFLLLGLHSVSLLEATLARLEQSSESLWDDEDVEAALNDLPSGAAEVIYHDFGALLNTLFVTIANAQNSISRNDSNYFEICDPSKLPGKLDFPYFLVAKSYVEEEGLFSKALIRKRSE